MISHLQGIIESIEDGVVNIDVGGVGYKVSLPTSAIVQLPKIGQSIKIYTYQVVREDYVALFGFLTREEKSLFSTLISVSGFGPKGALNLMGAFPAEKLVAAIAKGNAQLMATVPGMGLKTAQKIIVELKEKIAKTFGIKSGSTEFSTDEPAYVNEAIAALMTLGYSPREARQAIMECGVDFSQVTEVEELIKKALKQLA